MKQKKLRKRCPTCGGKLGVEGLLMEEACPRCDLEDIGVVKAREISESVLSKLRIASWHAFGK